MINSDEVMNTVPMTNHEPNDNTLLTFQLKKFFA